jgi:hypothetical protein
MNIFRVTSPEFIRHRLFHILQDCVSYSLGDKYPNEECLQGLRMKK